MKILALDLATKTGWCVGEHDAVPRFGTYTLPSTGEDIGRFVVTYEDWLHAMIDVEKAELIVFEAPIFGNPKKSNIMTSLKLKGLAVMTEAVCYRRSVMCRSGNLQTVKRFFAGHGWAAKEDMIATAHRLGLAVKDDNQADACGLWAFTVHTKFPDQQHRWALGSMGAAA